jgi:hypothetical protein
MQVRAQTQQRACRGLRPLTPHLLPPAACCAAVGEAAAAVVNPATAHPAFDAPCCPLHASCGAVPARTRSLPPSGAATGREASRVAACAACSCRALRPPRLGAGLAPRSSPAPSLVPAGAAATAKPCVEASPPSPFGSQPTTRVRGVRAEGVVGRQAAGRPAGAAPAGAAYWVARVYLTCCCMGACARTFVAAVQCLGGSSWRRHEGLRAQPACLPPRPHGLITHATSLPVPAAAPDTCSPQPCLGACLARDWARREPPPT